MGPICEVMIEVVNEQVLDAIDTVLTSAVDRINRTRKGKVWDVWIGGRPVHVSVAGPPATVVLAAGRNSPEDYAALKQLAGVLVTALRGVASEPVK